MNETREPNEGEHVAADRTERKNTVDGRIEGRTIGSYRLGRVNRFIIEISLTGG